MPPRSQRTAPASLRTLFNLGVIGDLTDGQLLERFATRDGEAAELAFAAIMERHGPMVLRACRSVLRDPNDAQDAFQATFLVLSRRADSLWVRDSIGPWLFAVALRVSRHSRSADARRRRHERRSAELATRPSIDPSSDVDPLESAVLAELDRLPARFRDPVVLCDLQGRTYDQAARHLGLPVGTVKSRLSRGRERLRDRLRRLGYSPSVASPIGLAGPAPALPGSLIHATSSAATRVGAGLATAGTVPASVLMLASGALRMMRLTSLIRWTAATLAIALTSAGLSVGAGLLPVQGLRPPARAADRDPLPVPSQAPSRVDRPVLEFDLQFIEVPGTMARRIGVDLDFVAEPPMGVAFLSGLEANLLSNALDDMPGVSIVRTPLVSAYAGAATIFGSLDSQGWSGTDPVIPGQSSVRTIRPGDPQNNATPVDPAGPIPEEAVATLTGVPTDDGRYLRLDLDVRDAHVVEWHDSDAPGNGGQPDAKSPGIPEVVRIRFEQSVTMPATYRDTALPAADRDAALLISLGLRRTVVEGRSLITDHFVLIRARILRPDNERPVPLPIDSVEPLPLPID